MRVLVACEFSGIVRDAFRARGHDAVSCDLVVSERPGPHILGNVLDFIGPFDKGSGSQFHWDMMLAFPPCTYLCSSGLHWNARRPERRVLTREALMFVADLLDAPIPKIALENPIGCISTMIRKPDQIIQPWQFGEDASKATCLWLKGLPKLEATEIVLPRIVNGKTLWANQTPSGQNKLGPSPTRSADRARTYVGIAAAMAEQWG